MFALCYLKGGTAVKPFTITALKLIKIRSFRQCKKKIYILVQTLTPDLSLDVHTVSAFFSLQGFCFVFVLFLDLGLTVQAEDKNLK